MTGGIAPLNPRLMSATPAGVGPASRRTRRPFYLKGDGMSLTIAIHGRFAQTPDSDLTPIPLTILAGTQAEMENGCRHD